MTYNVTYGLITPIISYLYLYNSKDNPKYFPFWDGKSSRGETVKVPAILGDVFFNPFWCHLDVFRINSLIIHGVKLSIWLSYKFDQPASSKWPFDNPNGGHDSPLKRSLKIPKRVTLNHLEPGILPKQNRWDASDEIWTDATQKKLEQIMKLDDCLITIVELGYLIHRSPKKRYRHKS